MARPKPWHVEDELWAAIEPLLPKVERRTRYLGGGGLRRLQVGSYRATYEIDGQTVAIKILMVGSTQV